ncbi:hypothetical protein MNEG_13842, partial [Monoraphidium neglectum]
MAPSVLGPALDNVCHAMAFKLTPLYSAQLDRRTRWRRVLRRAKAPEGGSWVADFDVAHMTPGGVARLAAIIDDEMLEGKLSQLADRPGLPLTFGVEEASPQER